MFLIILICACVVIVGIIGLSSQYLYQRHVERKIQMQSDHVFLNAENETALANAKAARAWAKTEAVRIEACTELTTRINDLICSSDRVELLQKVTPLLERPS
jgi:hypothetical protein